MNDPELRLAALRRATRFVTWPTLDPHFITHYLTPTLYHTLSHTSHAYECYPPFITRISQGGIFMPQTNPAWWSRMSGREQRLYLRAYPGTKLKPTKPAEPIIYNGQLPPWARNEVNDLRGDYAIAVTKAIEANKGKSFASRRQMYKQIGHDIRHNMCRNLLKILTDADEVRKYIPGVDKQKLDDTTTRLKKYFKKHQFKLFTDTLIEQIQDFGEGKLKALAEASLLSEFFRAYAIFSKTLKTKHKLDEPMPHTAQINREFVKLASSWENYSRQRQLEYLTQHPHSRRRLTNKTNRLRVIGDLASKLRALPFIDDVNISQNFYDEPTVHATSKTSAKGLETQVAISFSPKGTVTFESISVRDEDVGKKYSTQMIKTLLDEVEHTTPIYLSDPYNDKFWNHIKKIFPLYNWRFGLYPLPS